MSEISQKGYDAEITSLDILEKLGYEIIHSPEKLKRKMEVEFPSLKELIELQDKLEKWGYGEYWTEQKKLYTGKDKHHLKKFKDVKLTQSQKNKLSNLINQWNKWNKQRDELYDRQDKIQELINNVLGKSEIPKSSGMGKSSSIEGIDEEYFSKLWNIKFRVRNKKTLEKDKKIPYVVFFTPERIPSPYSKNGIRKAIGKTQHYFLFRPTHVLRHIGAQYWLAKKNFNYGLVSEIGGWHTIDELKKSYGMIPPEKILEIIEN